MLNGSWELSITFTFGHRMVTTMQTNGHYYDQREHSHSRFHSYDASEYSVASGRESTSSYKFPEPVTMNGIGNFSDFDFSTTPMNDDDLEVRSITLNTDVRTPTRDVVGRHLLYETALMDTQHYEILNIGEMDALKKDNARLTSKIEATQRKLALETKVRDAAQNLQRLYTTGVRPDTPQSPGESPRKNHRSSLRPRSTSERGAETAMRADNELAASVKKVDELNSQIRELVDQRQAVERRLLRHQAAVLAEEANRVAESAVPGLTNGHHFDDDNEESAAYTPNEFDGIRDILRGGPAGRSTSTKQQEERFASMQERLEQLNSQLRNVISEAGQTLGKAPSAEIGLDLSDDSEVRMENRLVRLEHNVQALAEQQHEIQAQYDRVQDNEYATRNAIEQHLDGLDARLYDVALLASEGEATADLKQPATGDQQSYVNQLQYFDRTLAATQQLFQQRASTREGQILSLNRQLHSVLVAASKERAIPGLEKPLPTTGQGYQTQVQYMEESLMSMEQLLQQLSQPSEGLRDVQMKAEILGKKVDEYDAVLGGLWDILRSDSASLRPAQGEFEAGNPTSPLPETFSLQAFSSCVQHLFDRVQGAREQHDILRRQIQQQRELNGTSDAEKDAQLTDLQDRHDKLSRGHEEVQQELANFMVKHEHVEQEASQSRSELINVMNECDSLRQAVESKQAEHGEMLRQIEVMNGHVKELEEAVGERENSEEMKKEIAALQDRIRKLEAHAADLATSRDAMDEKHSTAQRELETHASELQRKVEELESHASELTNSRDLSEQKHSTMQQDMGKLETEVVRLTTELTMAKADLDGAYGTRRERAGAQAAEVETLNTRNEEMNQELEILRAEIETLRNDAIKKTSNHTVQLEKELQEMTTDFQDLTKESIELEREREQLDALIDSLRERCDALEAQLADEKVRWLGRSTSSPSVDWVEQRNGAIGNETTSVSVLRAEFKKMMREQRGEGMRVVRVSYCSLRCGRPSLTLH